MGHRRVRGFVRPPSLQQLKAIADWLYIPLSPEEVSEYQEIVAEALTACDRIDDLPQDRPRVAGPRLPGYRPRPDEDPLNIFITRCEIKGEKTGKLSGKRFAVKDNIAVAGLPWTGGNRSLVDVIPEFDAVVVERLLAEGATLVGKLNQDDYAFSGSSDTSGFGAVRNPLNPDYSPGGSSSGEGAAVRAGYADLTLGVDQAGSGRIPAAWTGTCAIKPTHGLVPTFGIHYLDHTIDYICPCAKNVEDIALALEVISGPDPRDPQWVRGPIPAQQYSQKVNRNPAEISVGILKQGFGHNPERPDNDEAVMQAVDGLKAGGVAVREVSVPLWEDSWPIYASVFSASMSVMFESNGQGFFHNGNTMPSLAQAFGAKKRLWSHEFPPLLKLFLMMGLYLRREYDNIYYCKGQNVRKILSLQVDDALEEVDVLILPSTTNRPSKLLDRPLTTKEWVQFAVDVSGKGLVNTLAADLTGHPALVMPCGIDEDDLPYSIQFIGRRWDEVTVFQVARLYESTIGDLYLSLDEIAERVLHQLTGRTLPEGSHSPDVSEEHDSRRG
jgi:amidase